MGQPMYEPMPAMTRSRGTWLVRLAVVLTMAATSPAAASPPDPFARCRAALAARPDDYDSSYCFYQATIAAGLWDSVPAVLGELMAGQPSNFWLPITLGLILRERDSTQAEALYRRAIDGFREAGHDEGEVVARTGLRDMLFRLGRTAEAGREIDTVVAIAARSTNPLVKARVWTSQATQLQESGGDLGLAYRLLKQAEAAIFPDGPYRLKRTMLGSLGGLTYRLGRLDEALTIFERLDALAAEGGEMRVRASAQYNIVNTAQTKEVLLPSANARPRLIALAERAVATAVAAGARELEAKSHLILAELRAFEPGARQAALGDVERCLALASTLRLPRDEAACAWLEASLAGAADPARRAAAERRAIDATVRANNPSTQAFSARQQMRLGWETQPPAEAVRSGLAALDTIERLRDLQREAESSAELFSAWTLDYYWLSGRLLQRHVEAGLQTRLDREGDLALAFSVAERLRARTLLERLGGTRASGAGTQPRAAGTTPALDSIAAVQRRLLDPGLPLGERAALLRDLERLERDVNQARPRQDTTFADLDAVQRALAADEALLSFQVGLWNTYDGQFGGGSWLVMLTRADRSVFKLPDRAELARLVPVYAGLLARQDGLDAAASARLYERLLGPALRQLPPAVRRLVVVPDDVLHHLPFDALRPSRMEPPLAARYELVTVPSATLWRRWRTEAPASVGSGVLAFADPTLPGAYRAGHRLTERDTAAGPPCGPSPVCPARGSRHRAASRRRGGARGGRRLGACGQVPRPSRLRPAALCRARRGRRRAPRAVGSAARTRRCAGRRAAPGARDRVARLDRPSRRAVGLPERSGARAQRGGRAQPGPGVLRGRGACGHRQPLADSRRRRGVVLRRLLSSRRRGGHALGGSPAGQGGRHRERTPGGGVGRRRAARGRRHPPGARWGPIDSHAVGSRGGRRRGVARSHPGRAVREPLRSKGGVVAVRREIRIRHFSPRTERAYTYWIRRFIVYHRKRHPRAMGEAEVTAFLSALSEVDRVSASTQNQAFSALLFLYQEVLGLRLIWLDGFVRVRRPVRIPVVLTPGEVRALLSRLTGTLHLMASLLYGAGLRLFECVELRVKDIDLEARELRVRDGKGRKDRVTMIPAALQVPLRVHLAHVRSLHADDVEKGSGWVALPDALGRKYPKRGPRMGLAVGIPGNAHLRRPLDGPEAAPPPA